MSWIRLLSQANQTRSSFTHWGRIKSLIAQKLQFKPQELYPPNFDADHALTQHREISDRIFMQLHRFVNPNDQAEEAKDSGGFEDISLRQSTFISHMHAAYRITLAQQLDRPARFLDVGCGGGLKVLSAAKCFEPAEGLDLDPGYVAAAQHLLRQVGLNAGNIFEANALAFDGYGEYDVIYFFQPLRDTDLLCQLERRISEMARPGTVLIAPYAMFEERYADLGCGRVASRIYVTQSSDEDAAALGRKAENMGPYPPKLGDQLPPIWQPIARVLKNSGFN